MTATQTRIGGERKRIAAAREVEHARKALSVYTDRVPTNSDPNELMEFVMGRIRQSPLKLIDLKPAKPKSLGPLDAISLHLTLEGTYPQVHDLLNSIHRQRRLLRVESLSLAPIRAGYQKKVEAGPAKLTIQLSLAGLMDKPGSDKAPVGRGG